jgi:hypothetical protein
MGVKKIYLDNSVSLLDWVDENRPVIIETLYDNVFDFLDSGEKSKTVLKVQNKPVINIIDLKSNEVTFDFMLVRSDISLTIDSMLEYYESIEEYEKCAKLVETKRKFGL